MHYPYTGTVRTNKGGRYELKTKIIRLDNAFSTNDIAKDLKKEGEDVFVVAKRQSGGRGTKGRSFSSKEGGLYFSRLIFPKNLPAKNAFTLMQGAAASVCQTLISLGLAPVIKWPNDIYVNGKKICGILIENSLSGDRIHASIIGVGLNVNNELPAELKEIATTVRKETGEIHSLSAVEEKLFSLMETEEIYQSYTSYLGFLGERVMLVFADGTEREAVLLGVDEVGALLVQTATGEEKFFAAEVSLRV